MEFVKDQIYAGVSKQDITANIPAEFIHDHLFVRTVVFYFNSEKYIMMVLDAVGIGWISDIPNDFLKALRTDIEMRYGIPTEHILVAATHTHPSVVKHHCEPDELHARCMQSVECALASMVPVKAMSAETHEERFTMNRTLHLKNSMHWTVRHSNPCPPDDQMESLGPLDTSVGVLKLERLDGKGTLAIIFNFACHPLWAEPHNRVSANYPGVACQVVEDNLPGCTAIFFQGCAGDVIDRGFKNFEAERSAYIRDMGTQLGLDALAAARNAVADEAQQSISFATKTVRLPRRRDIQQKIDELDIKERELCAQLRSCPLNFRSFLPLYLKYSLNADAPLDYPYQYLAEKRAGSNALVDMNDINQGNIDKYLSNLRILDELTRIADRRETFKFHQNLNGDMNDVGAEIDALRIGNFAVVSSPTEMLTQVGLDIKAASPFRFTYIAGYCNGYLHYGAPADNYCKDGYEVTECMLGENWEKIHKDTSVEVLKQL